MNLLRPDCWQYELPWGSTVNPDTNNEIAISSNLVNFSGDGARFWVSNQRTGCWKRDKDWNKVYCTAPWAIGHAIARNEYRTYFGTYTFRFKLPNFRGAWPAIWLIDLVHESEGGQGMPPEIDVFEHFRKDSFLTRFHITGTFHYGKSYEADEQVQKKFRKCGGLWPVDLNEMTIVFKWTPERMTWVVNGVERLIVPRTSERYPMKPMNLLIGNGVGTMWKPENDLTKLVNKPLIIKQLDYLPL